MIDYNQVVINHTMDDLFVSVNDIYEQYDEGSLDYKEAEQILARICKHFLALQPKSLEHKIFFKTASDCHLWLEENEIYNPVTLTIHLED